MNTEENLFHCVDMHGVHINCSTMSNALAEVETLIQKRSNQFVCFFEANLFSRALKDGHVCEVINHASLIYPDGIAPAWAASLCSGENFQRVSGPTFLLKACEYGLSKNWRHFFLGGADGVADKLAENLKEKFQDIQIAGTYCPPFRTLTEEEEAEVKRQIEESHADLLWVGLGGPKQEFWMLDHQGKINVPVMLGVGAAFDFHSGNRPWAPESIRFCGMEWFWRMVSGGRKTFIRNIKCVSHISLVLAKDFFRYKIFRHSRKKLQNQLPNCGNDGAETVGGLPSL